MSVTVERGACVVRDVKIVGKVAIKTGTCVHPYAVINGGTAGITIGENNIIEEFVVIENDTNEPVVIGDSNCFKVRTRCNAKAIGNHNTFNNRSIIGPGTTITDNCTIGPACSYLIQFEPLPENTVIYGALNRMRLTTEEPASTRPELEALFGKLTVYHHVARYDAPPKTKTTSASNVVTDSTAKSANDGPTTNDAS